MAQDIAGDEERSGGIQVISRAATILNALGKHPHGMSLGAIANDVDLPRSTVPVSYTHLTLPTTERV